MITRTAALPVASMSELLVHMRVGEDSPGGSVDIHAVAPGLALGSNCSSLSGLEGNLPLGAQQRCTF